jgi:chaperone required for assembly of F1-ATPase
LTVERLFALRIATAISGSAVLALALWKKAFGAEAIFEASRVDERFQQERWGVDEEAAEREARLRRDFLTAARFLALL